MTQNNAGFGFDLTGTTGIQVKEDLKHIPLPELEVPEVAKKAVIVIDRDQNMPKLNYEFVGVNGMSFQIQRGVEAVVPMGVVNVLNDAVATKLVQIDHGDKMETVLQDYHLIPFRVLRFL